MKPIAIPRPTDPELRRQWDKAKRACEERGRLPLVLDDETRPVWECAQRAAAEVAAWPTWKHTEQPRPDPSCCVGDRSQCRCAPERGGWSDEDVEREKWIAVWNQTEDDR